MRIGIDVGAVNLKIVILDVNQVCTRAVHTESGLPLHQPARPGTVQGSPLGGEHILHSEVLSHKGQPLPALISFFRNLNLPPVRRLRRGQVSDSFGEADSDVLLRSNLNLNLNLNLNPCSEFSLSFTGSGGRFFAQLLNGEYVNEIVAQTKAVTLLYPGVKTILEIGGMSTKVIFLSDQGENGKIVDFAQNSICAAGTGSFLDQQAKRLGLSIEEFGTFALRAKAVPRIAGRCSVFAKTDMIHLQQLATPVEGIVAGLCFALVRNLQGTLLKGRKIHPPTLFHGGVAGNPGITRAIRDMFSLKDGSLIVPENYFCLNAFGAALFAKTNKDLTEILKKLENYRPPASEKGQILQPLNESHGSQVTSYKSEHAIHHSSFIIHNSPTPPVNAYLGVDVGSISTNLVLIDESKNVLAKCYLWTAGRPLEAVKQGLREIAAKINSTLKICGVCTTGSGRYLTADFLGADFVKNEITAQARAAVEIDPTVDTIFEIGGQDSKFISLKEGVILDFQMNKVCAAGTGSFLEEQAERLGIKIDCEFAELALRSETPARFGERCTVFMEEDLVKHQQEGVRKEDLVAGLSYSIVENYLNRVVVEKKIGKNIFFQGGVAFNHGVVAAFEKVLAERIGDIRFSVPPHHEVTGALGCALIALEKSKGSSTFKGFDLSERKYAQRSFECPDCANHCEINEVTVEGEKPLFYGSRCEKYELRKSQSSTKGGLRCFTSEQSVPDLFQEIEKLLLGTYRSPACPPTTQWWAHPLTRSTVRIGIPRVFTFYEFFPFFNTFFSELGFEVVLSPRTNREIIKQGLENVPVESCLPHKVAHGHILSLLEKDIDYLFLPSIINFPSVQEGIANSFTCPYVQTLPYVIKASLGEKLRNKPNLKILQPILYLRENPDSWLKELKKMAEEVGIKKKEIEKAFVLAYEIQNEFWRQLKKRGEDILSQIGPNEKVMVVVGRPYNTYDAEINLRLAKKLSNLGILAIPLDYLPIEKVDISGEFSNMYWIFGQRFLASAEIIKNDPRLYPLYLTNFACGPDSFILKYFKEKVSPKPCLEIELDEHSSDVGIITRLEAFLDSIDKPLTTSHSPLPTRHLPVNTPSTLHFSHQRTLYIPNMCDQAQVLAAAFEHFGVKAEVLPKSDEETLYWGKKYTLGKECYPCILTTGDMVKMVKCKDFAPGQSAFFMPSGCGPCRFGQYNYRQRLVLKELGYPEVPIYAPNQDGNIFRDLGAVGGGSGFVRLAWQGIVAEDILFKALCQFRPYEVKRGEADRVYQESLEEICRAIKEKGNLLAVMKKLKEKFQKIEIASQKKKPRIGIVGEIYIRSNHFSNYNLIRTLEDLGAEVYLAPTTEWLFYVNYLNKRRVWERKNFNEFLPFWIKGKYQEYDAHLLEKYFRDILLDGEEPPIEKILEYARPYLHRSYEGEAILSVGKIIHLLRNKIDGVVNVMPFTCMPGTIATAIIKRIKEDYPHLPALSLVYDDQEDPSRISGLEAFLYQVSELSHSFSPT